MSDMIYMKESELKKILKDSLERLSVGRYCNIPKNLFVGYVIERIELAGRFVGYDATACKNKARKKSNEKLN